MRKGFLVVTNVLIIAALMIGFEPVLAKDDAHITKEEVPYVQEFPSYMLGVLSGKITDSNGGGIEAITVCAVPDMNWFFLPLIINQTQGVNPIGQSSPLTYDALPNVCPNSSQTDETGFYSFSYLPSGDYKVYPVMYDVSFSPDSQIVSIPFVGTLDFQVLLRDPVIKPEAAVISEVSNLYLESISENGSTFTFSQSTSELQSVAVGDVMVSGASGMAPSGYLRRVISISNQGGKRIYETEPAFLEDIIDEGSAFLQGALTPAQVVSSDLYPGVKMNQSPDVKSRSFSFSIKDVPIYDHDGFSETVNDRVYASGTLELDLDYDFFIDFHNGTLENLTFAARATTSDKVEFYSDLELASLGEEWTIASYKFLPVNFLIGGVLVSAIPQLDLVVGANGGVSVGWSASVTHEVINRVGYEYINPAGWQPIRESSESISNEFIPQLSLEATAKGYMGIRFNFYIYGLAGPYVGMFQYFELKYSTVNTPKLTLSAGVNVPVGFRVEEYVHNFLEDKLVLKLNKYELIAVNTKTVLYETGGSNSAPNEPSEPFPGNGADQAAINPTLSWNGGDPDGDPVVYDVFFEAGDSSPDVRMAVDLAETNLALGLLQANTTYYWQVNATDSGGVTNSGPVWSFTTTAGYEPYPSNYATLSILDPVLSWTGGGPAGGSVVYDVYLEAGDSTPDIKVSVGQEGLSFDPGVLLANTIYYWQVVASDSSGIFFSSPVWTFVAGAEENPPPPVFEKLAPTNGSINRSLNVVLSWKDLGGGIYDSYSYCYDTTDDNSCSNWTMSPLGFSTHVELSGLSPNTTYYWQAKSVDDDGTTYANASSDSYWSFTTGADDIITADMISIPAGDFQMGCDPEHNDGFDCASDELPLHSVYLDAYKIDKYEVTTSQYAECVEAGVCGLPNYDVTVSNRFPYFGNPVYANYPVIGVTWYQANDYCAWAGKRLPTEAEWEKAARGSTGTNPYPWGESSPTCDLANLPLCVVDTDQVGSYPSGASPYGVMDMSGNVKEWVSDWYGESYYSGSPRNNPQGPASGVYKVLRGGSWVSDDDRLRLSSRSWTYRSSPEPDFGFRCVAPNE